MIRQISEIGLAMIEEFEGLSLQAYPDVAGVLTIGFGHRPATLGQVITKEQADFLLSNDLTEVEQIVESAVGNATDAQFDACVSLAFNIGGPAFRSSTVLCEHLLGNFTAAANAFLLWDKAHVDGKLVIVDGLLDRREAERACYLGQGRTTP